MQTFDMIDHTSTHKPCKNFTRYIILATGEYMEQKVLPGGSCGSTNHDSNWEQGGMDYRYYCKECFARERKAS